MKQMQQQTDIMSSSMKDKYVERTAFDVKNVKNEKEYLDIYSQIIEEYKLSDKDALIKEDLDILKKNYAFLKGYEKEYAKQVKGYCTKLEKEGSRRSKSSRIYAGE